MAIESRVVLPSSPNSADFVYLAWAYTYSYPDSGATVASHCLQRVAWFGFNRFHAVPWVQPRHGSTGFQTGFSSTVELWELWRVWISVTVQSTFCLMHHCAAQPIAFSFSDSICFFRFPHFFFFLRLPIGQYGPVSQLSRSEERCTGPFNWGEAHCAGERWNER